MNSTGSSRRLQTIVEAGVMTAAGLALAQIKLLQLPSGGSVSLGGLPVMVFAARRGGMAGMLAGVLMGLLSLARQPFVVHPLQFLLDYPLAYAALGLAAFPRWETPPRAALAVSFASVASFFCHVLAGMIFFSPPGAAWTAALTGSLGYNLVYAVPELILCAGMAAAITRSHPDATRPCV
ncbi:MAG: energy-coupled thiamine transporter ThiT [Candidatus Ozemobacteraceae bacterium]